MQHWLTGFTLFVWFVIMSPSPCFLLSLSLVPLCYLYLASRYDFKQPEDLPSHVLGTFDAIVIDPPFITEEVC